MDETPQPNLKPDHSNKQLQCDPYTLILSVDSILKGAAPLISTKYQNIDIKVLPGARIQDCSKYLTNTDRVPAKVVFNIGTNNIHGAKTINHIVRPLWYTIESAAKKFKHTEWYVNSIPYRQDVRDKYIDGINLALQDLCNQLGAHYLNTAQHISDDCYGYDGIHLNSQGANMMANTLANLLDWDQGRPCSDNDQNTTNNEPEKEINPDINFSKQPDKTKT